MAFLVYRKSTDCVVSWHDSESEVSQPGAPEDLVVIEMDYDPSEVYSLSLTLSEDGNSLINKYPGLSLSEQQERVQAAFKEAEIEKLKEDLTNRIDSNIKNELKESEWKLVRAADNDLVNGNTDETDALKAERQARRDAAKQHKAALNLLTDLEDVLAFDVTAF